jgi:TRAP-type C4-dicarboxylate transport system substrate-binding protein
VGHGVTKGRAHGKEEKMKLLRRTLIVLMVAMMVMSLSACGGSGGSADNNETNQASEDTSTPSSDEPSEETTKITLIVGGGHPSNTMSYTSVGQSFFQAEVKKRALEEANVDITWTEAYGGTVAGLTEALDATQNGLLQVHIGTFAFDIKKLLLMNMPYYLPFAASDPVIATQAFRKVVDEYPDVYEDLWKRYNAKFIAFGPTGCEELFTIEKVSTVVDLKGLKIGGAPAKLRWLEGTGAVTVDATFNDMYTGLSTGVFDGVMAWPDASEGYKFYEVTPYMFKVDLNSMAIQGITVNLDTWNSLPESVQKIFMEVGAEYEVKSAEAARDWDAEAITNMEGAGLEVTEITPEARVEWANSIENLPKMWIEEAEGDGFPGTDLMTSYIEAMKELGVDLPRDWLAE